MRTATPNTNALCSSRAVFEANIWNPENPDAGLARVRLRHFRRLFSGQLLRLPGNAFYPSLIIGATKINDASRENLSHAAIWPKSRVYQRHYRDAQRKSYEIQIPRRIRPVHCRQSYADGPKLPVRFWLLAFDQGR